MRCHLLATCIGLGAALTATPGTAARYQLENAYITSYQVGVVGLCFQHAGATREIEVVELTFQSIDLDAPVQVSLRVAPGTTQCVDDGTLVPGIGANRTITIGSNQTETRAGELLPAVHTSVWLRARDGTFATQLPAVQRRLVDLRGDNSRRKTGVVQYRWPGFSLGAGQQVTACATNTGAAPLDLVVAYRAIGTAPTAPPPETATFRLQPGEMACRNNLHQLGLAAHNYAAETRIPGAEDDGGEIVPHAALGLFVTTADPGGTAIGLLLPAVQSAREAAK